MRGKKKRTKVKERKSSLNKGVEGELQKIGAAALWGFWLEEEKKDDCFLSNLLQSALKRLSENIFMIFQRFCVGSYLFSFWMYDKTETSLKVTKLFIYYFI